jgi:hypothetical protein
MSVASTGTAGLGGGGGGSDVHLGQPRFLVSILHLTQLILLDGGMLRGEVSASGEGPFCPKEAGGQITLNGHGPVEVAQVDHKILAGLVGPKAQVTGCPVVQPDVPVQRLPFSVHSLTRGGTPAPSPP